MSEIDWKEMKRRFQFYYDNCATPWRGPAVRNDGSDLHFPTYPHWIENSCRTPAGAPEAGSCVDELLCPIDYGSWFPAGYGGVVNARYFMSNQAQNDIQEFKGGEDGWVGGTGIQQLYDMGLGAQINNMRTTLVGALWREMDKLDEIIEVEERGGGGDAHEHNKEMFILGIQAGINGIPHYWLNNTVHMPFGLDVVYNCQCDERWSNLDCTPYEEVGICSASQETIRDDLNNEGPDEMTRVWRRNHIEECPYVSLKGQTEDEAIASCGAEGCVFIRGEHHDLREDNEWRANSDEVITKTTCSDRQQRRAE